MAPTAEQAIEDLRQRLADAADVAAREGDLASASLLVTEGAEVNCPLGRRRQNRDGVGDFNGNY
jgi:hypothetical protein